MTSLTSRSLFLLLLILPFLVKADLPSCYRARCTHCKIQFIAQMCPQTCDNCPAQSFNKPVNNAGTTIVAHGKPTVYRTAEHTLQTLSQQDGQTQVYSQQAQLPSQVPTYQAPSPQQQQVASQPASTPQQYVPHAQQFNSQPAPTPNNYGQAPNAQFYNNQYSQFGQVQQPFGQAPQYGFPSAPTQQAATNGQFGAFPPPQTAVATPQQPGTFNPFQPFLQQSFQAQPQAPQQPQSTYNPFTFPTLPPQTFSPTFTPAPMTFPTMGTFPTLPPFPTHAPLTQGPQPPVTQSPLPQNNNYQPQGINAGQTQPNNNQYVQSGQSQFVDPQRPRQVYNTQQQASQPQYAGQQQAGQQQYAGQQPSSYLQPARSNAIPTVQVQQPARSIDSAPLQVEKQAYIGKGAPPAFVNQCPKQPNYEPCISKELANERFRNCCQRLGEGCSQLCNYDQSLTTLQLAVLTGRCPIGKVADMMICASGYEDATPCCQAYGVFEPGFEHCRPYCNPSAGLPNDGNIAEKYKCLGKLSQIQRCFYVTQKP